MFHNRTPLLCLVQWGRMRLFISWCYPAVRNKVAPPFTPSREMKTHKARPRKHFSDSNKINPWNQRQSVTSAKTFLKFFPGGGTACLFWYKAASDRQHQQENALVCLWAFANFNHHVKSPRSVQKVTTWKQTSPVRLEHHGCRNDPAAESALVSRKFRFCFQLGDVVCV